jgi:HSP20 family protein
VNKKRKRKPGPAIVVRRRGVARPEPESLGESAWSPPVDVYEADDRYVLSAEVPGVEAEALRIEVSGTDVAIRGERRYDAVCSEESYYRLEGIRGRFYRTFALPEPFAPESIDAELEDGVLRVVILKAERGPK